MQVHAGRFSVDEPWVLPYRTRNALHEELGRAVGQLTFQLWDKA
jgi:hypothetical protein